MKRSCKNLDLTNYETLLPWVIDCVDRHKKRHDFKKLICTVGRMAKEDYELILQGDSLRFEVACDNIAKRAAWYIRNRALEDLPPVAMEEKQDKSSLKVRLIGKECAMQQVLDHIACGASKEIWDRRIVEQQASSIKGRGQVYGATMISRWLKEDCKSAYVAEKYGYPYSRKCKYFVKLDAEKCYQNLRADKFLAYFKRDCANTDLIWTWEQLLNSHKVNGYEGFMIGALPSQDACQYQMSFVYRYAMDLHKTRRGKQTKLVTHMMTFMDDLLLTSSCRRDLKLAVRKIILYAKREFNINIKPVWQICDMDETPIDMMGFLIHADGNITVRPRVFLRARRIALRTVRRDGLAIRQATRICSYKGYFYQRKHEDMPLKAFKANKKLHLKYALAKAARLISERSREYASGIFGTARQDFIYAAT